MSAVLEEAIRVLAREIAREVVSELRAGELDMIDQSASPLGRRRHIAAVRARVSSGAPGGAIIGRRYLLSREAIEAELVRVSGAKRSAPKLEAVNDLLDRYGLEKGAA
jgi:hypothetical protein